MSQRIIGALAKLIENVLAFLFIRPTRKIVNEARVRLHRDFELVQEPTKPRWLHPKRRGDVFLGRLEGDDLYYSVADRCYVRRFGNGDTDAGWASHVKIHPSFSFAHLVREAAMPPGEYRHALRLVGD